jgi:hypothetical protein
VPDFSTGSLVKPVDPFGGLLMKQAEHSSDAQARVAREFCLSASREISQFWTGVASEARHRFRAHEGFRSFDPVPRGPKRRRRFRLRPATTDQALCRRTP